MSQPSTSIYRSFLRGKLRADVSACRPLKAVFFASLLMTATGWRAAEVLPDYPGQVRRANEADAVSRADRAASGDYLLSGRSRTFYDGAPATSVRAAEFVPKVELADGRSADAYMLDFVTREAPPQAHGAWRSSLLSEAAATRRALKRLTAPWSGPAVRRALRRAGGGAPELRPLRLPAGLDTLASMPPRVALVAEAAVASGAASPRLATAAAAADLAAAVRRGQVGAEAGFSGGGLRRSLRSEADDRSWSRTASLRDRALAELSEELADRRGSQAQNSAAATSREMGGKRAFEANE